MDVDSNVGVSTAKSMGHAVVNGERSECVQPRHDLSKLKENNFHVGSQNFSQRGFSDARRRF